MRATKLKQCFRCGLLILLIPISSRAQSYSVSLKSGALLEDLYFISISDSSVTFSSTLIYGEANHASGAYYTFQFSEVDSLSKTNLSGLADVGFIKADRNIFRGLLGGTCLGYSGVLVGGGIGYAFGRLIGISANDENMMGPVFGGIAIGVPTMAVFGLIYFSKHEFGHHPEEYSFSGLTNKAKADALFAILQTD